ncbi:PREDICTED: phospholipase D2 [Nicrophorus vespilloides]|uniref:Phospholipase n=1 Tax=Nicrophorus vespilloides TaxID=110193 RepID=A0ABM1MZH9_NICVS|nr:PREDICTED: phospholipase D2 [Nicrophorus vespilloides]
MMEGISTLELTANNPDGPPSPNVTSDGEFDDDLGVPESLLIDIIANSKDIDDGAPTSGRISFKNIHKPPMKFKSMSRDVFIKGEPIKVSINEYERNYTTHLINPYLYTICFEHGNFTWKVKKRFKHFFDLHQQLMLFRTSLNIPFPTKTHRKRRESFRNTATADEKTGKKKKIMLPRFPRKPEVLVLNEHLDHRMKQLEDYLTNLLTICIYRYHPATIEFLEISHLSFITDLGVKGKEGLIMKRTGSTQPGQSGCNFFGCFYGFCCIRCKHLCKDVLCATWRSRWFFVKDTCFGYIDPSDGRVKCVILFDQGFEVASGLYSTGMNKGFQIQTLSRQIVIKCNTRGQKKAFIEALKDVSSTTAKDFTKGNPHHSFAPVRSNITSCWFVDGAGYMACVADALEGAQEEIFIADWWLSPEIYLKRPAIEGEHWRLDRVLRRKAEEGVKIFVLLYKEFEMALGLNSYYSKQKLSGLHENIKVLRHPDHAKVGVFFWAHHEKIVVVDQTYAFLGGLDLCYGRWDDYQHRLTDLGSITQATLDVSSFKKRTSTIPGGDIFHPLPKPPLPELIVDSSIDKASISSESSESLPQLQPGDNLLMVSRPDERLKMNTPEMERKNALTNIKKNVKLKGKELLSMVYGENEKQMHMKIEVKEKREVSIYEELNGSAKYWIGKDYCNFIVKDFNDLESPFIDFIDRVSTPRMPWHDIAVYVQGATARDVSRHFIARWNATKLEKAKLNKSHPYLLPKSYESLADVRNMNLNLPETHNVTCQVLRSASQWSCGFMDADHVEQSIHEAYIEAISKSQHYIYIENQFFISMPQSNRDTKNLIGESIYKRIVRAHNENATFRVFVVMPLLPGFEGEVGESTGTSLHAITHWNYASISRGRDALLTRLRKAGIEDPIRYISFYGLRTHSSLNGEPITELIYVHSKLMIVDDKLVICGSANINDRSLIGKRDSEIAVRIEDQDFDDGRMNGNSFPCGKYAGSLRKYLFKEHLGLLGREHERIDIDITDPICDEFYLNIWYATAELNTMFYDKVFHCIPTDEVETFSQLKEHIKKQPLYMSELSRSEQMLNTIEGHLVLLPLNFLCSETLTPGPSTVEGMMPSALWT